MNKISKSILNLFLIGILISGLSHLSSCQKTLENNIYLKSDSLEIMSFNIRYGLANDGSNHWDLRKPILIQVLKEKSADLIGVQEALNFQLTQICEKMPEYKYIGVGRDDGKTEGEYAAIFYKPEKLDLVKSGTFWLSDHPDQVASIDWGNACTRICTWAVFETNSLKKKIALYNLHLDHISQFSREKSIDLLIQKISQIDSLIPVIITGDFNAGEQNPAILKLLAKDNQKNINHRSFFDSYRLKFPQEEKVGTFNSFTGDVSGDKIDYIITDQYAKILDTEIIRFNVDGRYPSDHFPIYLKFRF